MPTVKTFTDKRDIRRAEREQMVWMIKKQLTNYYILK